MKGEVDVLERAAEQFVKKDRKTDGQRGGRGAARYGKLRTTVDESPGPTVSVAQDAVLAGSARQHRQKLRVRERASQRKQPGRQPNRECLSRRAHIASHHAG